MTVNELLNGLTKITNKCASIDDYKILIGQESNVNSVAALIIIDKGTKFRGTHVRVAESLSILISDILNNYQITADELVNSVIPIAGFDVVDLARELSN